MNGQPVHPMMMGMPIFQQAPEYHGNEIPARVRVALAFLEHLTNKESDDAMESNAGSIHIEGIEPLLVERETQAAACNLLTKYFEGKMEPSRWEQYMLTAFNNCGTLVACPNCQGLEPEKSRCRICDKAGVIRKFIPG